MTTYNDRESAEIRLQALAPDIAKGLGLTIEAQQTGDFQSRANVTLVGTSGEVVNLWVGQYGAANRGKVEICGSTYRVNPYASNVWIDKSLTAPTIRVSLEKDAAGIVADIKRRMWPAYLAELEAMRAAVKEYETRTNDIQTRAAKLAEIIGVRVDKQAGTSVALSLYHSKELAEMLGDVQIRATEVRIDRLYVSDEIAAEILRVLVRARKRESGAE